jgi:hypothetical protein
MSDDDKFIERGPSTYDSTNNLCTIKTVLQIWDAVEEDWMTVTSDNIGATGLYPFIANLATSNLATIFTEMEHVELAVMQQYLVGENFVI